MRIRWTVPAVDDLQHIKNYLQQNYPHFAEPTVRTIYQRIRSLKTSPNRGKPGHRSGTRELALTPVLRKNLRRLTRRAVPASTHDVSLPGCPSL